MIKFNFIERMHSRKVIVTAAFVIVFLVGISLGLVINRNWKHNVRPQKHALRESGHTYTNPLLDFELAQDLIADQELRLAHDRIEALVKKLKHESMATHISVYFRDLNDGPWFGIEEDEEFYPASLLKVPVMIACLKQAEHDPGLLTKPVLYKAGQDLNRLVAYRPASVIEANREYTFEELLYRMIVYSDNNTLDLIMKNLDSKLAMRTFTDLGLKVPANKPYFISVKGYASFFRVLFNSSYLNREMSEYALEFLANSEFKSGIVASVPPEIPVAHKFGEQTFDAPEASQQLHDCGIVYYPKNPYLLCIMTRGKDFKSLERVIQEISAEIYRQVSSHEQAALPTGQAGPGAPISR